MYGAGGRARTAAARLVDAHDDDGVSSSLVHELPHGAARGALATGGGGRLAASERVERLKHGEDDDNEADDVVGVREMVAVGHPRDGEGEADDCQQEAGHLRQPEAGARTCSARCSWSQRPLASLERQASEMKAPDGMRKPHARDMSTPCTTSKRGAEKARASCSSSAPVG
eukprot:scaffold60733_cov32-Tisochrysis_lutea.AAC.1